MPSSGPDNANPIIHTPAGSSNRRSRRGGNELNLSDEDEWTRLGRNADDNSGYDYDADLTEEIDSEEIFGPSSARRSLCSGLTNLLRHQISSDQSRILNIL